MGLEYKPKNRRYYDSLRNYIMAYLPREHEMTILKFVDSAIMEAYKNGQHLKNERHNEHPNNKSY
jgi:hypothetical protein